ncbi:MAG: YfdX family protein [Myxococcota bacterium]|nr:YfdX family protein [Myxococcota bacterium]
MTRRLLACLISLTCLTLALPAVAEVETTVTGSVQAAEIVTHAASQGPDILGEIAGARAALQTGDLDTARRKLAEARADLEILHAMNPGSEVQSALQRSKDALGTGGPDAALLELKPVSQELVVIDDYAAARVHVEQTTTTTRHVLHTAGHQHVLKSMAHLEEKDVESADAALAVAIQRSVYTEVDLPVAATLQVVKEASAALSDGHAELADKMLGEAEASAQILVRTTRQWQERHALPASP